MRVRTFLSFTLAFGLLVVLGMAGTATAAQVSPFDSPYSLDRLDLDRSTGGRIAAPVQALAPGDPVDFDAALIAGANYLRSMQADVTDDNAGNGTNGVNESPDDPDDAGWDWSVTSPPAPFHHTTTASATNIYGATAQGLYYAYLETGDASYFTALQDYADHAVAAGPNNVRTGIDMKMLMLFNDLYSAQVAPTSVYADAAKAKYDGRITIYGSATALAEYIRDVRNGQGYGNGIIGWDIGVYAVAAQMLYARYGGTYDQDADAIAEVLWQDSFNDNPGYFDVVDDAGFDPTWTDKNFWWYTLGLCGLIDAFSASGSHTAEITGLAQRLLDSQYGGGGISGSYGANPDDEDWQSTGYAAMTLGNYDQATYQDALNRMGYFAGATQDASGGWVYSSGAHYPETCGEITAALYFTTNDLAATIVDDDFVDQASVDAYNLANATNYTFGFDAFGSIQAGIDGVNGSTVTVLPGTYYETLNITTSGLNVFGVDRATVIIDPTGKATNNAGIYVAADNVTLKGFTLRATPTNSLPRYGLKFGEFTGDVAEDLTVENCYRSGVDALGSSSLTLTNLSCLNNGGHGLALTDCNGVAVTDLSVGGNGWQGVSVATWGRYTPLGTSGIVFSGTNNFADIFQLEMGDYNNPGVAPAGDAVITYSTDILDGADVTVQSTEFGFSVHGEQDDSPGQVRVWLVPTLNDAALILSLAPIGHLTGVGMYIEDLDDETQLYVTPNGSIQAAIDAADPGDDVNVAAGTYAENFDMNKLVHVIGAGSGTDPLTNTVITQNTAGAGDTKIGIVQLSASGNSTVDPILLQNVRLDPDGMAGISVGRFTEATGQNVAFVELNNVVVVGNNVNPNTEQERGLYVDLTSSLTYLTVTDCAFDSLTYGWYLMKQVSADASTVQHVTVTNTTFNHNNHKGIYAEKLADATFTGCTVSENGFTSLGMPSYFVPWMAGVDLNLKSGTYANLYFTDCVVTNNALGGAKEGVGFTVKGRGTGNNPSSSYTAFPAWVDNVVITGGTYTGNERGIRFGEPGKENATPTNVVITGADIHSNVQQYIGIDGSAYGGVINTMMPGVEVSAEENWWGTVGFAAIDAATPGEVDFSPWCSDATHSNCTLTSPVTEVWVDDDWTGANEGDPVDGHVFGYDAFATIQAGVDGVFGSTVNIYPGLYEEQVVISSDVALIGSGPGATIIQAPNSMPVSFGATTQNYPVVLIQSTANATVSNLTIDGLGRGNTNYRFVGIGFSDAGGGVFGCEVLNIQDTPFSGNQHGVAIYSWNDDGNARTITVDSCLIDGFQKTGMALNADDGSPLTVAVLGNTVTGEGATTVTAQNGIQVWCGTGSGTVAGNTITGIAYDNTSATTKWAATSILNYYTNLDIVGNTVTGAHLGLYNIDAPGNILENELTIEKIGVYAYGIIATDPPEVVPSPVDAELMAARREEAASQATALLTVDISRNTVNFSGGDNTATAGIEADAGYGVDDLAVTVDENFVNGFEIGLSFWACESSCSSGLFTAVSAYSNSLVGNTYGVYSNVPYLTVNASTNWYGATDPATVGAMISGDVDYTPWLGFGTDADALTPGFQATLTDFWVDDNSVQTGALGRTNEAVGLATSGGTIHLAAGSYEEQVEVAFDLTLAGEDVATTFLLAPTVLPAFFVTGTNNNRPVLYVHDANVDVSGLTVDGLGRGNANYRLIGVGFWNAGGSMTGCRVTGIMDTPFSGSQHGNGVYAYNNTGGPYAINLTDVTVDAFQKNGITLLGEGLTATVANCNVQGAGPTTVIAQNGIQMGYGSGGAITDCTVDGIAWSGASWIASGILLYQGSTTDITGCTITNSQANVLYQETNGTVSDLTVVTGGVANEEGISIRDYAGVKSATDGPPAIAPVDVEFAVETASKAAPTTIAIDGAVLTGTANAGYGIAAWSIGDDVNVTVTNSTLGNWEVGLVAYESGSAVDMTASQNTIAGNLYGAYSNAAAVQDLEGNYWGSFDGPADALGTQEASISTCFPAGDMMNVVAETQPSLGDTADGLIDYCPWISSGVQFSTSGIVHHCPGNITFDVAATAAISALEGANIGIEFPAALSFVSATVADANFQLLPISQSSDGIGYDTVYIPFIVKTGWLDGAATLYTITMAANDDICSVDQISMITADLRDTANVAIPTPPATPIDVTVDCADPVFATTTADGSYYNAPPMLDVAVTDNCDLDAFSYQIDGCNAGSWTAIEASMVGGAYAATWTLPPTEFAALTEAEHCIRFKVTDDAGRGNADSCSFTWCFTKDVTIPAPPTDFVAQPGHNKVKLSWTNAASDVDHIVVMRTDWNASGHGYPEYGSLNGSAEGPYPSDTTTGDYILAAAATAHTDLFDLSNATRDIYHYAIFTVDAAGNVSSGVTARATSYWIGDVGGSGGFGDYDGNVFAEDLNPLGIVYGSAEGDANFNGELDYGPSTPGGAKDVPIPDDSVNFEDGILFAINFGAVNPSMKAVPLFVNQAVTGPLTVALTTDGDGHTLALVNNSGTVKGLHAVMTLGPKTQLSGVTLSDELQTTDEPIFTKVIAGGNRITFDAILLGQGKTIAGSGELAHLTFATTDGSAPEVVLAEVSVRDLSNGELDAAVQMGPVSNGLPTAFALAQNFPNPFNPTTTISYQLPAAAHVTIEVFNALGQQVRTLVDAPVDAGTHTVVWDSRDGSGRGVSSGVYFYRIKADGFTETRKMMLLK